MTKSRMALMLLLAVLPNPASALPAGADQLIGTQRRSLRTLMRIECPSAEDPDEIVVCGSREEEDRRHRLPQATTASSSRASRAGGEQRAALAEAVDTCTPVGRDQQCNGGVDLIGIGFTVARAIAQAIANRD